jgi:type II secretory pathway pseudopilin PulG
MTMVEILVVIAIIAILIGLIFAGLAFSLRSSNVSQTKAILADLNAMVAEAELIKPLPDFLQEPTLNGRPDLEPYGTSIAANNTTLTYVPQYLEVDVTPGDSRGHQPLDVPIGSGSLALSGTTLVTTKINNGGVTVPSGKPSPAEVYTAYVLNKLLTLPKNQELFSKIPSTRFTQIVIADAGVISTWYENPPGSGSFTETGWPTSAMLSSAAGNTLTLPVPLDAWGHEIYFVPGGGLVNSNWGSQASFNQAPTSSNPAGLLSSVANSGSAPFAAAGSYSVGTTPVVSPTGKSFWVSAGPDGDMLMGDDNIYSFTP